MCGRVPDWLRMKLVVSKGVCSIVLQLKAISKLSYCIVFKFLVSTNFTIFDYVNLFVERHLLDPGFRRACNDPIKIF